MKRNFNYYWICPFLFLEWQRSQSIDLTLKSIYFLLNQWSTILPRLSFRKVFLYIHWIIQNTKTKVGNRSVSRSPNIPALTPRLLHLSSETQSMAPFSKDLRVSCLVRCQGNETERILKRSDSTFFTSSKVKRLLPLSKLQGSLRLILKAFSNPFPPKSWFYIQHPTNDFLSKVMRGFVFILDDMGKPLLGGPHPRRS